MATVVHQLRTAVTIQEAFDLALQHHRAGRRGEAEGLYRQVLAAQPDHVEAWQLLGLLAHQAGNSVAAVELLQQALARHPQHYVALGNLGEAYRALGKLDEAIACYQRALEIKPDHARASFNLGNALSETGRLDAAVAAYRRAVASQPDYADAYNNLGVALARSQRLDEAVAAYRCALRLRPDHADAHNNLGITLGEQGRWDAAVAEYRRAIELQPEYPEAHNNLGNALKEQGRLAEAMASYRRALELQPDYADAHGNSGVILTALGRFGEAIAESEKAIRLQPAHADAQNNLGIALAEQGRLGEAIAVYERLLKLHPSYADAYINLGNAWKDQGRVPEAVAVYRRALEIAPADAPALSNLIYTLLFIAAGNDRVIRAEQERWHRQIGGPAQRFIRRHENERNPERPLRIGYVSADFRDHVVGRNLRPLFQNHDRRRHRIFCYAAVVRPDRMTEEFREQADGWRNILGTTDEALAEMIRADRVDILVDLAQHTAGNRLPVLARRPAPVQASFAGYPASAGVEAIAHRISDRYLEQADTGGEHIHFIDSFWCYDPCGMELPVSPLPAERNGGVTFGSLNNFCKVTEPMLRLWGRVLAAVEGSRLMLMSAAGSHRQRGLEILRGEGIDPRRVEWVEPRGRAAYLELYHRIDVMLDTFPYNGHTTSLDALWMGVPVISVAGSSSVSRAGLSQLSNLGLPEMVAYSQNEFVRIAQELAGDRQRLAELRRTLRGRMEASVLMDGPRFACGIEAAYRAMWREWCAQEGEL